MEDIKEKYIKCLPCLEIEISVLQNSIHVYIVSMKNPVKIIKIIRK
jgi:hypothetical protein